MDVSIWYCNVTGKGESPLLAPIWSSKLITKVTANGASPCSSYSTDVSLACPSCIVYPPLLEYRDGTSVDAATCIFARHHIVGIVINDSAVSSILRRRQYPPYTNQVRVDRTRRYLDLTHLPSRFIHTWHKAVYIVRELINSC